MVGWIKLHRQVVEWGWFTDSTTFHLFMYCLLKANIKDGHFKSHEIKRGSFFTSVSNISLATGLSVKAIRLSLDKLVSTQEIKVTGASDGTLITICNYDNYQHEKSNEGQAEGVAKGERREQRGASEGSTIKEYNNKEERNNGAGPLKIKKHIQTVVA